MLIFSYSFFQLFLPLINISILLKSMTDILSVLNAEVKKAYPKLFKFALYLSGNKSDAHDLVMDAIKGILQRVHKTNELPHKPEAYMIKSVKTSFKKAMTLRNRFVPTDDFEPYLSSTNDVERSDPLLKRKINQALFSISDVCREVLTLIALGYSYEEVQEITGIRLNTVRSKLSRCREAFKGKMSDAFQ